MLNFTTTIKQFASLNRAPGPTWTDKNTIMKDEL
jgi:hypothetical protein